MQNRTYTPPNAQSPKVFIVNDCRDDNARARQTGELARYIEAPPEFVRIHHELEASCNLVDLLRTFRHGKRGGVVANTAERTGTEHNGIRFGYFQFDQAWVVTTIGEVTLSLPKHLGIAENIRVLDTEKTTDFLIEEGFVSPDDREDILTTQFRSSVFSPAVLAYLILRGEIPCYTLQPLREVPSIRGKVSLRDNFANLKLTTAAESLGAISAGTFIPTVLPPPYHRLPYYPHLYLVPDKQMALIRGSSGIGTQRFLELVFKGGSAGKVTKLSVGDQVL